LIYVAGVTGRRGRLRVAHVARWWWADPVGALAMLPVIVWQGWETLAEAREHGEEGDGAD
jgi:divalent metal cation (Fe/Co/Zn/Cd) transporter